MKKHKMPKDLGIKMGTKEQVIWEAVVKQTKVAIETFEKELLVQRAMLALAEQKILEEKAKL